MADNPTLLMAGSFGFGNTGDDAILHAMLADLRSTMPDLRLIVVSGNPQETREAHAVEVIHWQDVTRIIDAVRTCDLITLGGGGLFYDYWGFDPGSLLSARHTELAYYTEFALLAALLDKPLMIYAVGVGPLVSEEGRSFTRIAFQQARVATVRDPASKALLESLGIDGAHVHVTADPAFNFRGVDAEQAKRIVESSVGMPLRRPWVGVVLRNWDIGVAPAVWERHVADALDTFVDAHGGTLVFMPFQAVPGILTDDAQVADRVRSIMRHRSRTVALGQECPPAGKAGVLGACDVVLAMRLHAVIFAMTHGVPVVALNYDPKVSGALARVDGDEHGIDLAALTADKLGELLKDAYRQRLRARPEDPIARLADKGRESARLAADLLRGNPAARGGLSSGMLELIKGLQVAQAVRLHSLDQAVSALQWQLEDKKRAGEALRGRIDDVTNGRDAEVAALDARLRDREQEVDRLSTHIGSIGASRAWRLAQGLSRLRRTLLPPGSKRERILWKKRGEPPRDASTEPGPRALVMPATPSLPSSALPCELARSIDAARGAGAGPGTGPAATRSRGGKRRVGVLTNRVIDPHTGAPCFGGGERYCLKLGALLRDLGFEVTLFQVGPEAFRTEHQGFEVVGLPAAGGFSEFQSGVCDAFHRASEHFDHVIHNLPEYASGMVRPDAIVICHGIWFDHDNYGGTVAYRTPEWFQHLHRVFSQPAKVVSVDTNSINVVRALCPGLDAKMTYLPNWVDTALFHPPARRDEDARVVLFPRRSQVNRGSRILEAILQQVPHDWRFLWVGEGDAEDTRVIRELATRERRLEYHAASFADMPGFYRRAAICVIPTLAAEGTSLACLEGLATGSAIVATHVGGLGNLIQPGINGLMVDANPEAIAAGINFMIEHPHERRRLAAAGLQTAEGFRLEAWQARWEALLRQLGWLEAGKATHA